MTDMSLDSAMSARLARIVEAEARREAAREREPVAERERRKAREAVIAELPRLFSRLSSAVAEVNDAVAEQNLHLHLILLGHQPTSEATYRLSVTGDPESAPHLLIGVDWTGAVRAMLHDGAERKLVLNRTIFEVERRDFLDLSLRVLEARYG